jgi:hypothetical protein
LRRHDSLCFDGQIANLVVTLGLDGLVGAILYLRKEVWAVWIDSPRFGAIN